MPFRRAILASLFLLASTAAVAQSASMPSADKPAATQRKWAVVLHGGAGVITRGSMTPEQEASYRAGLHQALAAATAILDHNGSALDAVEAAVRVLEDDPSFNAGRGAVFAYDGTNQLDSAIMDGATLRAGAVADVTHTRHPVSLARSVMERSPYVLLSGTGADQFAAAHGLEMAEPAFFFTERRWQSFVEYMMKNGQPVPPRPAGAPPAPAAPLSWIESPDAHKFGTVGAVALDRAGNVAAATSTGGIQGKRWNRIGDTPVIGAGTYASNSSCAVSGTGTGEFFIRLTVARTVCSLVEYKGMKLDAAARDVIQRQLTALHGDGGLIAIAPDGQMTWSFNTPGMYRARQSEGGKATIAIYADEP